MFSKLFMQIIEGVNLGEGREEKFVVTKKELGINYSVEDGLCDGILAHLNREV